MRIPRQPPHLERKQPRNLTARQTQILDDLEALYLAHGFSRQTLDVLANELHCSKMTLYTLASGRDELAIAVMRRYFDRSAEELERDVLLTADADRKVVECIRAQARCMRQMSEVCFHEVTSWEPTRNVYEAFARDRSATLAALLDETGTSGAGVPGAFIADMVRVMLESMCAGEFEAEVGMGNEEALDHLVEVAVSARRARPSRRYGTKPTKG